MSDPEAGWSLISVETRPRAFHLHHQVVVHVVLALHCILDEDVVTLHIVDNIVGQSQIVRAVQSVGAVEALMGRATMHKRLVNCSDLVEVHCVAADLEGLANISHLNVRDASNNAIVSF